MPAKISEHIVNALFNAKQANSAAINLKNYVIKTRLYGLLFVL
jgi:hypothetical protein